jgi:hypothetical protein
VKVLSNFTNGCVLSVYLPCFISLTFIPLENFRFVVDESFLAQIDNHCQLEIHADTSYSLLRTEDLPPDFVVEPIDEDTENGRFNSFMLCYSVCIVQ